MYSYSGIITEAPPACGGATAAGHPRLRPTADLPPPASNTPATNIMSSQSRSPPPLLPGAVTVSDADAVPELSPAGPVESALAAIGLA